MLTNFKFLYALRGLIAYVAFSDLCNAVVAFVEKKCFLNELVPDMTPLPRMYAYYVMLQGVILFHCTLFIHYRPLMSAGIGTLLLSIMMLLLESRVYKTMKNHPDVMFFCSLNGFTAFGLIVIFIFGIQEPEDEEDENTMLLRKVNMTYKRRSRNNKVKKISNHSS